MATARTIGLVVRAWLVIGALAAAHPASAQPAAETTGKRHFETALGHYKAARYDEAVAELRLARAADPQPQYLWAMAQAYRFSGECLKAIDLFGEYLRTGPKPDATKATQIAIDDCEATLAAAASAPPSPQLSAPAAAPPPPPPPSEPLVIREVQRVHTRELYIPWYRDWQGDVLAGAGVATLLVGAGALLVASGDEDNAAAAATYDAHDRALRSRDRAETIGTVALVAGGALVAGALVRYALRPKRVKTEVVVEPVPGGATLGVSWVSW